jgi:hypothetical protein
VIFSEETPYSGELRAYGPKGQYVWYDIQLQMTDQTACFLSKLLQTLKKKNLLKVAKP